MTSSRTAHGGGRAHKLAYDGAPRGEDELEEVLTTPTPETIDVASRLGGDLVVLGAGGKMGPTLARLAKRSFDAAGVPHRVICVSRFGSREVAARLQDLGIETLSCDLLDSKELERLPDAPNVAYLAGYKFGAAASPHLTWAMNCYLPACVADRYHQSRVVVLSTGNVYPFVPVATGGATEATHLEPVGEYAQSCLGRERMFEYMAEARGTRSVLIRLNYATDLRYGVLLDVAQRVDRGESIDLTMGWVNTIWQGDANAYILRAFDLCAVPPEILNVTSLEVISVRDVATKFAELLGRTDLQLTGAESETALLSNATRCHELFGPPRVSTSMLIEWTAEWVIKQMPTLNKTTHFQTRDGRF